MKTYILIIDGNTDFRSRVTAILRDKGYAVFEAETYDVGKDIISNVHIDLMCVDGMVSGSRGHAFIHDVHREQKKCKVAFIAHPDQDNEDATLKTPIPKVDLLLYKPISAEELVYKLETLSALKRIAEHEEGKNPISQPSVAPHEGTIQDRQAALKAEYAAKVPSLFAELGGLLVSASNSSESFAALKEAHRIAHMLNGTAGSLGFSDVSTAVHSVETALKEMLRIRRLTSVPASGPLGNIAPQNPEPADEGDRNHTITANVLVVDEDEEFLKKIVAMGKEHLIRVHPVKDETRAIEIINSVLIDAAIVSIPTLSDENKAFHIAKTLRAQNRYANLPIGFVSVDASMPRQIAAVHSGGSVFLSKPINSDTFAAAIRRLVPAETTTRPKILIVDDDQDFLAAVSLLLEAEGIETITLDTAANIVEEIYEIRPDILLLDVVMDQVNGLDACRVLRSMEEWRDLPILVLTVYGNRKTLVKCFEAGADDYIEKPIIKEELLARIRLRLERIRMFKERADTDALTGLPTRRPFLNLLKMRISEGIRFNKPVSLCLIDLDNFKQVNDTYGHLAGDRVLAAFGRLLNSRFRTMDLRGRWGGEEFVLAFYGEDGDTAKMIVGRVLDEFKKVVFTGDDGEEFSVSFSAGIASFPAQGKSVEELFRYVDEKLYISKDKGRSRIES